MKSVERERGSFRGRKEEKMKEKKEEEIGGGPTKTWEKVLLLAACKKGTRGGCCHVGPTSTTTCYTTTNNTPVSSWKQHHFHASQNTIIKAKHKHHTFTSLIRPHFSVRKLGAALWEFHQYFSPPLTMFMAHSHGHHRRPGRHHLGGSPDHHPDSLRGHIATLLVRHHQSAETNKHALQPLSPASYGSSLEMAPHNRAATPDSSIEMRRRIGESSYNFKTSTELLKVLNRIWSLEEQHASNISLIKVLKNELDHTHARIKGLLRDQQANRHKIDELLKQVSEDNLARKSKEHECVDSTIQSLRIELEDERKLRKRSESLHRKLGKDLFEVKVAFSTAVKDLEKERRTNSLLEQLCDEFAQGIREYAGQVHASRQKSDQDRTGLTFIDEATLQISELWLDDRVQTKDREAPGIAAPVDKLRPEIEAFLAMRQMAHTKENHLRCCSLQSIPEASSAPRCITRDDSTIDDSQCVDVTKGTPSNIEEQKEIGLSKRIKGQSPTSVEMSDTQNPPPEVESTVMKTNEQTPMEISMLQKSDVYDSIKESTEQKNKVCDDEGHGSNSKTVDKRISELLLSEGGSCRRDNRHKKVSSRNPMSKRNPSPVKQWITSLTSPDPQTCESSTKFQQVRDNTSLKSKLQEPKSKGPRSRLKILKGLS